MTLSGGVCSFVDTTLFIQAGDVAAEFITLSYITEDTSIEAITDASRISAQALNWTSPAKSALSFPNELDIVFDSAGGISGSFSGRALIAGPGTPTGQIAFDGRFSCTRAPLEIRGARGVRLTEARCNRDVLTVSAGGTTGDAAVLAFDPGAFGSEGSLVTGSLSFRAGNVEYRSLWMQAKFDRDGLGGVFGAIVAGPDGIEFEVSGGFSCL